MRTVAKGGIQLHEAVADVGLNAGFCLFLSFSVACLESMPAHKAWGLYSHKYKMTRKGSSLGIDTQLTSSCCPLHRGTILMRMAQSQRQFKAPTKNKTFFSDWSYLILRYGILQCRILFPHDSSVDWHIVSSRAQALSVAERIHMDDGHQGVHKAFIWLPRQALCMGCFQLVEQVFQHCVVYSVSPWVLVPPLIRKA